MNSKTRKDLPQDPASVPLIEPVIVPNTAGYRNLLAGLLQQSLDDVKSWLANPTNRYAEHRGRGSLRWIRRRRSIGWVGPVTFDAVCEGLDLDADSIHGRVEMLVAAASELGSVPRRPGSDDDIPALDTEWHAVPSARLLGSDSDLIEKFCGRRDGGGAKR